MFNIRISSKLSLCTLGCIVVFCKKLKPIIDYNRCLYKYNLRVDSLARMLVFTKVLEKKFLERLDNPVLVLSKWLHKMSLKIKILKF